MARVPKVLKGGELCKSTVFCSSAGGAGPEASGGGERHDMYLKKLRLDHIGGNDQSPRAHGNEVI